MNLAAVFHSRCARFHEHANFRVFIALFVATLCVCVFLSGLVLWMSTIQSYVARKAYCYAPPGHLIPNLFFWSVYLFQRKQVSFKPTKKCVRRKRNRGRLFSYSPRRRILFAQRWRCSEFGVYLEMLGYFLSEQPIERERVIQQRWYLILAFVPFICVHRAVHSVRKLGICETKREKLFNQQKNEQHQKESTALDGA